MRVKDLSAKLAKCDGESKLRMITEEELECMLELWDDKKRIVSGKATRLFSEDVRRHEVYLIAVES